MDYWLGALDQRVYPGAGDIDDCWVVASLWALRYVTHLTSLPTITTFRAAAGNPDDPLRADGGNHTEINQAINRLWPTVRHIDYASLDWTTFTNHLKAGASASVATLSSHLPANLRFGFSGAHQIAVIYRDGEFYAMNPLQKNGDPPIMITEAALKDAIKAVTNGGWILGVIFPKINLGTFRMLPRSYNRWKRTTSGGWTKERRITSGWSAVATPKQRVDVVGTPRNMCLICTGMNAGYYVNADLIGVIYTP